MQPKIALLLCIIFTAYLLKLDHKRSSGVSYALWIPAIWMMISGSRMISLWFTQGSDNISSASYIEGSPIDRMIYIVLIIVAGIVLFQRNVKWTAIFNNNRWIMLLYVYGGISILWSDFPLVSLKRHLKDIGYLLMVLVVLTDRYPAEAVTALIRRFTYILVPLSLILYKYYPSYGRSYHPHNGELMVTGVSTGKNGLGLLCVISGIFLFWQILSSWRRMITLTMKKEMLTDCLILSITLWLLIKVDSATALVVSIVGIGLLLGFNTSVFERNKYRIGRSLVFGLILLTPLMFIGHDFILHSVVNLTGHEDTFWGRVGMWPELIDIMGASHIIGTGYESFWLGERMERLWIQFMWLPKEAHNGFVDTFLTLGYIGLVLLTGIIITTYNKISRRFTVDYNFGQIAMTFFVLALLYNISESSLMGGPIWFAFLLFAVECCRPSTRFRREKILS